MVYTANWGIIWYLPPIKGTRKLHGYTDISRRWYRGKNMFLLRQWNDPAFYPRTEVSNVAQKRPGGQLLFTLWKGEWNFSHNHGHFLFMTMAQSLAIWSDYNHGSEKLCRFWRPERETVRWIFGRKNIFSFKGPSFMDFDIPGQNIQSYWRHVV